VKIHLTKIEAKAVESARLYEARIAKDVAAIEAQIRDLSAKRQALLKESQGNTDETVAAIGERAGVSIPVDGFSVEKKADGTAVLSWPDAPAPAPEKHAEKAAEIGALLTPEPVGAGA
jgi:hypothetical protein